MTNEEWIKSLTGEDFVRELMHFSSCVHCPCYDEESCKNIGCTKGKLKWLQEEHNTEENQKMKDKQELLHEMYEQGRFDALADLDKEGKVVLTKEDYDRLCHLAYFGYDDAYKKGSKETAEKYHKAMRKIIHERDYVEGYAEIGLQEENDEIAKQLGVDIKEN